MAHALSMNAACVILALMGASCGPSVESPPPTPGQPDASVPLPIGIVRTDGKGDLALLPSGSATCSQLSSHESAFALASANAARQKRGLGPLVNDPRLQQAAQQHACEMAGRGVMTHRGASSKGPSSRLKSLGYMPRVTSENIAAGRFGTERAIQEWTNSPDHLSNMLIPGLRHHGFGYAIGADGKTRFWTAVYAQPR